MQSRWICVGIFSIALSCQTGCSLVTSGADAMRQTSRYVKPRPFDHKSMADEENDNWEWVGDDARGSQKREADPDRWWKKYVQSPRARDIEKNLGID